MCYINKLPHQFLFNTVFDSSFSFPPVKSFSSEKAFCTLYVNEPKSKNIAYLEIQTSTGKTASW